MYADLTVGDAPRLHRYTFREYLELEATSAVKHEFLAGEIYAMPAALRSMPPSRCPWARRWSHDFAAADAECTAPICAFACKRPASPRTRTPPSSAVQRTEARRGARIAIAGLNAELSVDEIYDAAEQ